MMPQTKEGEGTEREIASHGLSPASDRCIIFWKKERDSIARSGKEKGRGVIGAALQRGGALRFEPKNGGTSHLGWGRGIKTGFLGTAEKFRQAVSNPPSSTFGIKGVIVKVRRTFRARKVKKANL